MSWSFASSFAKKPEPRTIAIPSKAGDPLTWKTYAGQEQIKRRLKLRIEAMQPADQLKALFYAPFGYGKTALARTLAYEMFEEELIDHYLETIGLNFASKTDVDDFIVQLKPFTFVFIDELHTLPTGPREAFYTAIQDNFHVFYKTQKQYQLPKGITWVGATTQLGQVHPSLQRRLIPVPLEPLEPEDLVRIVRNQKVPVDLLAAKLMAERCTTPWEIRDELYATAEDIAVSRELPKIAELTVLEACDILGIDRWGLRPRERRVLETLWHSPKTVKSISYGQAYAMAQTALIAISGVDKESFQQQIEPKLLKLGYLKVSTYGRELTTKALNTYFGGV